MAMLVLLQFPTRLLRLMVLVQSMGLRLQWQATLLVLMAPYETTSGPKGRPSISEVAQSDSRTYITGACEYET